MLAVYVYVYVLRPRKMVLKLSNVKNPSRDTVLGTKTRHVCTTTGSSDLPQTASSCALPSPSRHASGSAGQTHPILPPPPTNRSILTQIHGTGSRLTTPMEMQLSYSH